MNGEIFVCVVKVVFLFKEGVVLIILCCGWVYRYDSMMCIGDVMVCYVVDWLGLVFFDVLIEWNFWDIVGDVIFFKMNFYNFRSWFDVFVVMSDYYVDWMCFIFLFVYGKLIMVVLLIVYVFDDVREYEVVLIKVF